jgi:hypothetical protein
MARRRNQAESIDKAVEAAVAADKAKAPMGRFRAVARRIVAVRPEELAEQKRQYDAANAERRRARRKPL